MIGMLRTRSKPLLSVGTMIIDARLCLAASGLVTAITMANAEPSAALVNHLWPSMTYSSPERTARHDMIVGFEPGFSGSVIEKHERIFPLASGSSHLAFCSGVPYLCRISMLPASGAWQPNT